MQSRFAHIPSRYVRLPSFYEQVLEIVRLIMEELLNETDKKLDKRIERVSFAFNIPGVLRDFQKLEIEKLLTIFNKSEKEMLYKIKEMVSDILVENTGNL